MIETEPVVFCGLSEQEVTERRARGLGNDAKLKTGRTYGQIVRDNLFTFFNLVLFGLAAVLLLLASPRDAFFTAGIALLNAFVATVQEIRAKRKLDRITLLTRPKAVVIREGQEKEVDPSAIVVGDLLVAGPGDQIVADGILVGDRGADLDESLLSGESDPVPKRPGDPISSGSFAAHRQATAPRRPSLPLAKAAGGQFGMRCRSLPLANGAPLPLTARTMNQKRQCTEPMCSAHPKCSSPRWPKGVAAPGRRSRKSGWDRDSAWSCSPSIRSSCSCPMRVGSQACRRISAHSACSASLTSCGQTRAPPSTAFARPGSR